MDRNTPSLPLIVWTAADNETGGCEETDEVLQSNQRRTRTSKKGKSVREDEITSRDEHPIVATAPSRRKSSSRSRSVQRTPLKAAQNFEFVNSTGTLEKSQDTRKFVRSHAMKWFARERSAKRGTPSALRSRSAGPSAAVDVSFDAQRAVDQYIGDLSNPNQSPPFPRSTTPFYGAVPFDRKPHYQTFSRYYLNEIAYRVYPLETFFTFKYNPVRTVWFPLAISDELLLEAMLYSSAAHINVAPKDGEAGLELGPVIAALNQRLESQAPESLSDSTLAAVTCLAVLENRLGNGESWNVHMKGLSEMIRLRGGLETVDRAVQTMMCRVDINGALDFISTPHIPTIRRSTPPIWLIIPPSLILARTDAFMDVLITSNVSLQLTNTLLDLFRFNCATEYAVNRHENLLDPLAFDVDTIIIVHEVLNALRGERKETEKAIRIGALIYTKLLTRGQPFLPANSKSIARELKSALLQIPDNVLEPSLFLWLLFMGGVATPAGVERDWFATQVISFTQYKEGLQTWDNVKSSLKKILWIDLVHDAYCRQFWDEADAMREHLDNHLDNLVLLHPNQFRHF